MKQKEFKQLLQSIKNQTYTNAVLVIDTDPFDQAIERYRLKDKHIISLTEALKQNPYITKLILTGNNIGDIGAIALAELYNLERLDLACNCITAKGAIALAKSNIRILNLESNQIYCDEKNYEQHLKMINAFINNRSITDLNLDSSIIPSELIAQLIKNNTMIESLCLGHYLTDEALKFVEHNHRLEELCIRRNNLTDLGAEYIAKNTNLKTLHIEHSNIGNVGANLLSNHLSLQNLTLKESDISNEGAKCFFGSNLAKVVIFNGVKHDFMSSKECVDFEANFKYAQEYKQELLQKLEVQREYYRQITNGEQYPGINPNMNDLDSIQNAIDVLQNRWAEEYQEQRLVGDISEADYY